MDTAPLPDAFGFSLSNAEIEKFDKLHPAPGREPVPKFIQVGYDVLLFFVDRVFEGKAIERFWFLETVRLPAHQPILASVHISCCSLATVLLEPIFVGAILGSVRKNSSYSAWTSLQNACQPHVDHAQKVLAGDSCAYFSYRACPRGSTRRSLVSDWGTEPASFSRGAD